MFAPTVILLCATGLYLLIYATYQVFFSPLAEFPGPLLWSVSRLPWAWHTIRGDLWETLERLHVRYGKCVRIAPDEITTTDPSAWKELYNSAVLPQKDPRSSTPPPNGVHSLFTATGETHRRLRGIFVNGFSSKALRGQGRLIEYHTSLFMDRIGREAAVAPRLNIAKLYGYVAFDIITDLTYGESINGLRGNSQHEWIERYYLQAKAATFRNLASHFPPLDWLLDQVLQIMTADQRMRNFNDVSDKIDRRLALNDTQQAREDLLSPVLGKLSDNPGKDQISKAELVVHGFSTVAVNSQATSLVLSSVTYLLLTNDRAMKRLRLEIDDKQFKESEDITVDNTSGMLYLDAVIKESLRIHHPTPMSLPRVMPNGGRLVTGRQVPAGFVAGVNLQTIQTSLENWLEPKTFHPERFLDATHPYYEDRFTYDDEEAFHPFSVGPRNCLGGRLFQAQTRMILARLLHDYDMELSHGNMANWCERSAYLVFQPRDLFVTLKARRNRTVHY